MTNAIGTGTRNLSANVPTDELAVLKKLASEIGVNLGTLVRGLILRGAAEVSPDRAREIQEIRRRYYGAAFLFLICFSVAASWFSGDDDCMRAARVMRVRTVRPAKNGRKPELEVEFV